MQSKPETEAQPSNPLANLKQSAEGSAALPWYVTYTCPRHEKRVATQIEGHRISCFLPFYRSTRCWKDRRKELELPWFHGYGFVQIEPQNMLWVLERPG